MRTPWMVGGLVSLLAWTANAEPRVAVEARMYMRDTGELNAPLLKQASSTSISNLDYGVRAGELLIDVTVPDGVGERLTVTVKQGKLNAKQTWKVQVGSAYGIDVGHHPLLLTPAECGGPLTITAKIGKVTEKRTIDFACSD